MSLQRRLDGFESRVVGDGECAVVKYTGQVDQLALRRAVTLLGHQHPVLRARIFSHEGHYILRAPKNGTVKFDIVEGDDGTLRNMATRAWDPSTGVAEIALIHGKDRGSLLFRMDHAVTDGPNLMAILGHLWRYYTKIVNGHDVQVDLNTALPRSHDDVLKERFGDWTFSGRGAEGAVSQQSTEGVVTYDPIQRRIVLSRRDTARLISTSRSSGVTVHGLVCGAALVAQRDHVALKYKEATRSEVPMMCLSPVDLRTRVSPAVSATETTNLQMTHRADVLVAPNAHPIEVGQDISDQIHRALLEKRLSMMFSEKPPTVKGYPEPRLLYTSVSNIRRQKIFDRPTELDLEPLRMLIFRALERPVYGAWTSEEQFTLLAFFPDAYFGCEAVDDIVSRVANNLVRFGVSDPEIHE